MMGGAISSGAGRWPGRRCRHRLQLISLLEAIAAGRGDLSLSDFDDGTVAWAIRSGLGPLLYRAVRENLESAVSPRWYALKAADLTARVVIGEHLEAMAEIIDGCRAAGVAPLVLLKGISIGEACYPEPHLRLMRDLDFMVQRASLANVKAVLERLGYRQRCDGPAEQYEGHHHAAPFYHQEKKIWVEAHHALLSPRRRASGAGIFRPESLAAELCASEFQGRAVARLSAELQLVYLATHWAQDFNRVGGLIAVVDAIYLLQRAGDTFRWDRVIHAVHGSVAATYLYLLLSYMEHHRLIELPSEIRRGLFFGQRSFGKANLKAAHAIIDRYFVAGREPGRWTERTVRIVWNTLTLPGPPWRNVLLMPVNLSLPHDCRIH